jgi:hypothetical protein
LIKKVIKAEEEAQALRHRIEHLGRHATNVGRVLRYRQKQRGGKSPPPAEVDVINTIDKSLRQCQECLQFVCRRLKPFETSAQTARDKWSRGFKFVNSAKFIEAQLGVVNTHLENLTLSCTLLSNLDSVDASKALAEQNHVLQEVRALLRAVVHRATDEQSTLFQLSESELDLSESHADQLGPSNSLGEGADLFEDEHADEESVAAVQLSRRCSECWRRNLPMPDTELAIAVKHKQAEIARGIIQRCGEDDVTRRDAENWTLLHYAAHNADHQTVLVLLETEAGRASEFVNATSKEGQTALMSVAKQANTSQESILEIAKELIDKGCNIDAEDESVKTRSALYFAIDGPKTTPREHFVELLVGRGANKDRIWETYPEKAELYSALRIEPRKKERTSSTSSVKSSRLFRALSRSD